MTLIELLVGMLLASILLTGLVQIAASAKSMFRLQESLAEVQESGRFAIDSMASILRQTGYTPQPWNHAFESVGFTADSANDVSARGDRVVVRTWSDRNCFDNPNPATDADGLPRFYLRESVLELSTDANLTHTCRYGPAADQFVNQLQRQGLVQNAEALQIRYAEDTNGDGRADRWVGGGEWEDENHVLAVQLALLLASHEAVAEATARSYQLLDQVVVAPEDGKLRRVLTSTQAMRGRNR